MGLGVKSDSNSTRKVAVVRYGNLLSLRRSMRRGCGRDCRPFPLVLVRASAKEGGGMKYLLLIPLAFLVLHVVFSWRAIAALRAAEREERQERHERGE